MATGIECVGIVLGILPLLIEGIKAYNRTLTTCSIKRARQYRSILRQYSIDLASEHTQFKNTWYRIVELIYYDALLPIAPNLDLDELKRQPEKAVSGLNIKMKDILSRSMTSFDVVGVNEIERALTDLAQLIEGLAVAFLITKNVEGDSMVCICY